MGNNHNKPAYVEKRLKTEKDISSAIDDQMSKDKEKEENIIKLLLLGAGESGKSTLFRQMVKLYAEGFAVKDRQLVQPMIHNNTIEAMKELVIQSDELKIPECKVSEKNEASKAYLKKATAEDKLDATLAMHIKALWADPGIQETYRHRSDFQLVDSAQYFFENVDRIATDKYLPSDEDLIRFRVRTTGIVEKKFQIENNRFLIVDVGGQRNERKKWIHCFESVTAVIFVAALSEYDKVLYEDGKTNRMHEALELFSEIANSRWFVETSMILFLNKNDLFTEKIKTVPLTKCFPDFSGKPNDYEQCVEFVKQQFIARKNKDKQLYIHVTCATSANNVQVVFSAVKNIIISRQLIESGLN